MARNEVYRIEIPIETKDNYSEGLKKARQDVTKFEQGRRSQEKRLRNMTKQKYDITIRAVDRASKVVAGIASFSDRVAKRGYSFTVRAVDRATRTIGAIRRGILSIPSMITVGLSIVGVSKLSEASLGAAMNFENYGVSMNHWLKGNTKAAEELMQWMGQFADKTPFNSAELFPALTRGVGISGGDINQSKQLLKVATDMASLTPGKTVQDAMEALADAQMGEFERMKEFNMKMTKEQYKTIGGWKGFIKQVDKTFGGGAEKLSATAFGKLSTIKGYIGTTFRSMGTGILESLKPRLDSIGNWLDNNQDKWQEWKRTVQDTGSQASQWVFSRLETGFNFIRTRYLENDEFKKLDFKGKIDFVLGDINKWWTSKGQPAMDEWWESSGRPWMETTGLLVGESIFKGMMEGGKKGMQALGGMWAEAMENPSVSSIGGAAASTGLAGWLALMVLNPFIQLGGMLGKLGKWGFGKGKSLFGKGKTGGGKITGSGQEIESKSQKSQTQQKEQQKVKPLIVDQYGNPISSTDPETGGGAKGKPKGKFKFPKLPKGVTSVGKRLPYIGTALGLLSIAGSSQEERPGAVGGVVGGAGGAALGALAGTAVFPGIGTAIGGLGGGILGAIGGEKIMNWIFGPKKVSAASEEITSKVDMTAFQTEMATAKQNINILSTYLAKASNWVVGGFYPLQENTPALHHNVNVLTTWLAQASGWVVSLHGIQEGASGVKTALSNLSVRINGISPSTPKGAKKYAAGGFVNRPHLGMVGEAGPEMIIPLSSGRRNRAMDLYAKTGALLGVRQYADGGLTASVPTSSGRSGGSSVFSVQFNEGSIQIDASSYGDPKALVQAIADDVAGAIADKLEQSYSNMPVVDWR